MGRELESLRRPYRLNGIIDPIFHPRSPQPFPVSGKPVKLVQCPRCRLKHLPIFFAPHEKAYPTRCRNCGIVVLIKPQDVPVGELMLDKRGRRGFHHNPFLRPKNDGRIIDARRYHDELRIKHDLGQRRYWKR